MRGAVSIPERSGVTQGRFSALDGADRETLVRALPQFYTGTSAAVGSAGERPRRTPSVRLLARKNRAVTSLRREVVATDVFSRQVLRRLDGEHTRADLTGDIERLVGEGLLSLEDKKRGVGEAINSLLERLGRASLLIG